MPANNHRGNIVVSTGFLNERNAHLAEMASMERARAEALGGEYFDPEEEGYDLAFGPKDRVTRVPGGITHSNHAWTTPHDLATVNAEERRMEGNN